MTTSSDPHFFAPVHILKAAHAAVERLEVLGYDTRECLLQKHTVQLDGATYDGKRKFCLIGRFRGADGGQTVIGTITCKGRFDGERSFKRHADDHETALVLAVDDLGL